jgi:hypothetical protein
MAPGSMPPTGLGVRLPVLVVPAAAAIPRARDKRHDDRCRHRDRQENPEHRKCEHEGFEHRYAAGNGQVFSEPRLDACVRSNFLEDHERGPSCGGKRDDGEEPHQPCGRRQTLTMRGMATVHATLVRRSSRLPLGQRAVHRPHHESCEAIGGFRIPVFPVAMKGLPDSLRRYRHVIVSHHPCSAPRLAPPTGP